MVRKTRNDLVFNDKVVPDLVVVIHKLLALLTSWKPLLKMKERPKMEMLLGELTSNVQLL
jgi:hypothetical protein